MLPLVIVVGTWNLLVTEGKELIKEAFAEGTMKNLESQWNKFHSFCEYCKIDEYATITPEVLVAYIAWLCRSMKSQTSVANYVNGIKTLHVLKNRGLGAFNDISVTLALRGVARRLRHTTKQAQPMTPPILMKLLPLLDITTPLGATYWALFLLTFFMFMRKSNMVPTSKKSFDSQKQLVRGDFASRNGVLLVNGKWSKTNQFGSRSCGIPVLPLDSPLCPVRAFEKMVELVPANENAPAFCHFAKGVCQPITYGMFQRKLKSLIGAIGLPPTLYSSHSFRRGGATLAFKAGISGEVIKVLGDWRSDAYQTYLEIPLQVKTKAASKFRDVVLLETNQMF